MKVGLLVNTGKAEGKVIPVTVPQFIIGRDPQCHLRPNSPVISKRHCAILIRGEKVFARDLDSTNGSFLNDEPLKGERELKNDDRLKVGPLSFVVRLETSVPVDKQTPMPRKQAPVDEESVGDLLLAMQDDDSGKADLGAAAPKEDEVPEGSTMLDLPKVPDPEPQIGKPPVKKVTPAKSAEADTRKAAEAILAQYARRKPAK